MRNLTPDQIRDHVDLKTSQRIIDEEPECIPDALNDFGEYLTPYYQDKRNKSGAHDTGVELAVLNDQRRALQRVFSQLIADELTPATRDLLDTGTQGLELISSEVGTLEEWEGARYRHFYGDEARFAAAYEAIFGNATGRMFHRYTAEQADLFVEANANLTGRIKHVSEQSRRALGQTGIMQLLADEPYVGLTEAERTPMRLRSMAFQANKDIHKRANNGLRTDLSHQLQANAVAFGEFYGSTLGAMLPYIFEREGYSVEEQFPIELANIAPISATAALKDSVAEDVLFVKRDEPCFTVTPHGADRVVIDVIDTQKPLQTATKRIRDAAAIRLGTLGTDTLSSWGRCPSNQAVPTEESTRAGIEIVEQIDGLTGGHAPEHLKAIVTSADVCAITGVALMMQLWRRGIVTLRPTELKPVPRKEPTKALETYRQVVRAD